MCRCILCRVARAQARRPLAPFGVPSPLAWLLLDAETRALSLCVRELRS